METQRWTRKLFVKLSRQDSAPLLYVTVFHGMTFKKPAIFLMRCERPVEAGLLIGAPNEKTLGDEKYVHDVQILMYRKKENVSQRNISIETFLFD